jgi:hypothetical protein
MKIINNTLVEMVVATVVLLDHQVDQENQVLMQDLVEEAHLEAQ